MGLQGYDRYIINTDERKLCEPCLSTYSAGKFNRGNIQVDSTEIILVITLDNARG